MGPVRMGALTIEGQVMHRGIALRQTMHWTGKQITCASFEVVDGHHL